MDVFSERPRPSSCGVAAGLLALVVFLVPRVCLADNLGALGTAFAVLIIGALVVLAATVTFIVLAVVVRRAIKRRAWRGARALVIGTRVAVAIWFVVSIAPVVYSLATAGTHDLGWVALFCLLGGAPAHIAALAALVGSSMLSAAREGAAADAAGSPSG